MGSLEGPLDDGFALRHAATARVCAALALGRRRPEVGHASCSQRTRPVSGRHRWGACPRVSRGRPSRCRSAHGRPTLAQSREGVRRVRVEEGGRAGRSHGDRYHAPSQARASRPAEAAQRPCPAAARPRRCGTGRTGHKRGLPSPSHGLHPHGMGPCHGLRPPRPASRRPCLGPLRQAFPSSRPPCPAAEAGPASAR